MGAGPLNPNRFVIPKHEGDPTGKDVIKSVLEMPDASPQPWSSTLLEVPKGNLEVHHFQSKILDNERRIWVYRPPSYTTEGSPYYFVLLFDGLVYTTIIPTPTILDNLLHDGKIPLFIALLVDSPDPNTRDHELTSYSPFADFIIEELLPWFREHYHVTHEPSKSIVGGSSHGGQGAAFIGLRHPEIFGNVLAQSGSFWWKLEQGTAYEWLADNFVAPTTERINFYLNMGSLEDMSFLGQPTPLEAVQRFRDTLRDAGYLVHYEEFSGGHDYLCWRGGLAKGLKVLMAEEQKSL